jgi:uncharacterized membrane protein YfcA
MLPLSLGFFAVALVYATVGFGGGSSYTALLALSGIGHTLIPKLSLTCNLLVVSGGCYHFWRSGLLRPQLVLPFALSSVPMALLGGSYPLQEKAFYTLLSVSLLLAGLRLLFIPERPADAIRPPPRGLALGIGAILGLISGLVGIGGGIFLSPLLINLGWARAKEAAAAASVFILLNSVSGLLGQLLRAPELSTFGQHAPLLVAVIIGGQCGSFIGTHRRVSYHHIQKATGLITLAIGIHLLLKLF